jgi:hypothetical protein
MKKTHRPEPGLVVEYLENISRNAIKRYPDIITEYARRRSGVYALYKGEELYYVGLAKNLRSRLHGHLKDRHALAWNRFSVYLTKDDEHIKELESLVLRIASPKGNRVAGKFSGARDLMSVFSQRVRNSQRQEFAEITTGEVAKISKDSLERRIRGEYDTLVCPAHQDGFEIEFLGKNRWYPIRVSKSVQARLKYVAIYVTSPTCQISHYGRIQSIKPWKDSGKYMVHLSGKAKRIGPISHSPGFSMQGPRLALMARLIQARTLGDAF